MKCKLCKYKRLLIIVRSPNKKTQSQLQLGLTINLHDYIYLRCSLDFLYAVASGRLTLTTLCFSSSALGRVRLRIPSLYSAVTLVF